MICDHFIQPIRTDIITSSAFLLCNSVLVVILFLYVAGGTKKQTFEIYYCDAKNKKFLKFHERLQSFILFFIDAASYIDVDDEKWRFFTMYELLLL